MEVAVSEAKGQLTELLRRAEAGEEVILTRHGRPVGKIVPVAKPKRTLEERRRIIAWIQSEAAKNMTPGPDAAHSQDFLYDDYGLPK